MSVLSNTTALLGKELRTEFRSRELLTTTIVFILIVMVLFSFTFDPTAGESRRFGPGLLWLAFLFASSLMLQPCFLREMNNDTLSALRLSVSDPFAIFLAKLAANTLFLLLTELLLLPIFAILYNIPVLAVFGQLVLVFFLFLHLCSLSFSLLRFRHGSHCSFLRRVPSRANSNFCPSAIKHGILTRSALSFTDRPIVGNQFNGAQIFHHLIA